MPTTVIFDVDGRDIPFDDIRMQIGKNGDQLMPVFLSADDIEAFGEELGARRGAILRERYLLKIEAFPGVRDLFEHLRAQGLRMALALSAKEDELETYKKVADIKELVDVQTSSDDADTSKPHPGIFFAALEQLGNPEDVVIVGDTAYDAEAASQAGLRTIGLLCGGFPEDGLWKAGCIAVYRDPADLLDQHDSSPLSDDGKPGS